MAAAFSGAFEVIMTDETQAPEEQETISDLFVDEPEQEAEAETEATETDESKGEETEETESETETEETESEEQTKTEEEAEPPSEKEEETPSVPRQALLAERQKRQQLEEQLKQLQEKHQITDENEPDPVDDPEGWKKFQFTKWKQEQWQETADKSRATMLEKHQDYEEKEKHFVVMAQANPELIQQMQSHHDPAAFAYEKASEDMTKTEKAIEERVIARLKKEGKLKEESVEKSDTGKSTAAGVSDLIKSTGAGKNSETKEELPEDPGDFFD